MLNTFEILTAIADQLENSPDIKSLGYREVMRAEPINANPNLLPWLGVYPGTMNYDPRTLGRHVRNRQAELTFRIVTQAFSAHSGVETLEALEKQVETILEVLLENPTYANMVDITNGVEVAYELIESEVETVYFQEAIITITCIAVTGAA